MRLQAIDSVLKGKSASHKAQSRRKSPVSRSKSESYNKRYSSRSALGDTKPKSNEQDSLYETALGVDKLTRKEKWASLSKTLSADNVVKSQPENTSVSTPTPKSNAEPDRTTRGDQLIDKTNSIVNSTTEVKPEDVHSETPIVVSDPKINTDHTVLMQNNASAIQEVITPESTKVAVSTKPTEASKSIPPRTESLSTDSMDIVNSDSDDDDQGLVQFLSAKQNDAPNEENPGLESQINTVAGRSSQQQTNQVSFQIIVFWISP